jgi:hypothetical protein
MAANAPPPRAIVPLANSQAKLAKVLNDIAYAHIQIYANAIKANAQGKANAAAVARAEANAKAAANAAAAAAKNVKPTTEMGTNTNTNAANAAKNAANAAANAVIAKILAGNYNNPETRLLNVSSLSKNITNRQNVQNAIKRHINSQKPKN